MLTARSVFLAALLAVVPSQVTARAFSVHPKPSLEWRSINAESIGLYLSGSPSVTTDSVWTLVSTRAVLDSVITGHPEKEIIWEYQFYSNNRQREDSFQPKSNLPLLVLKLEHFDELVILPSHHSSTRLAYNSRGQRITSIESALSVIDSVLASQDSRRSFLSDNCLKAGVVVSTPSSWDVAKAGPDGIGELIVPVTRRHEQQLLEVVGRQGEKPHFGRDAGQWMAARILCHCFKADVSEYLYEMLESDWTITLPDSSVVYPSRQFAYGTLTDMGIDVEVPTGFREDYKTPDDSVFNSGLFVFETVGFLPLFHP